MDLFFEINSGGKGVCNGTKSSLRVKFAGEDAAITSRSVMSFFMDNDFRMLPMFRLFVSPTCLSIGDDFLGEV